MKILEDLFSTINLVLLLVRRDYAVQFAGTLFGFLWLLIQYTFQVAVFYVLFGVVFSGGGGHFAYDGDYFLYIMSGMMLWVPVSEMLIRSCSIIFDNRALVKRTGMGMKLFLWIPVFQGMLYFFVLFSITFAIGYFRNGTGIFSPVVLIYGIIVILFFGMWAFIFSKLSLILKDFSPIMRLLLQMVFWVTPIVYTLPEKYSAYAGMNPLFGIIEINRWLFHAKYLEPSMRTLYGLAAFIPVSIVAALIAKFRLESIALDQI